MSRNKGFALIPTLLMIGILIILWEAICANLGHLQKLYLYKEQQAKTRYLALGGLAEAAYWGKDNTWHTDDLEPPANELKSWLCRPIDNGGSNGQNTRLESGSYKFVKIAGQPVVYSIGFIGADPLTASFKLILKKDSGKIFIL